METRPQNQNEQQKVTKSIFRAHFIHLHRFWTYGSWLISRAMKNQKEHQRATKSSKEQQKTEANILVEKIKTDNKKAKRATKSKETPNGNQAFKINFKKHRYNIRILEPPCFLLQNYGF